MKLAERFESLKKKGEKALVLFITAGDQPLDQLSSILDALIEGGADVIEVGLPFSDPFGEGVTIQGSSFRSLERGTTTTAVLDELAKKSYPVPIVTMGYYNPALRYGLSQYADRLADVGACGSILQDLVPEEADEWCAAAEKAGIDTIFLTAPTSTSDRLGLAARRTTGFVYAISRTGVTGAGQEAPPEVKDLVALLRKETDRPICVGFGISKPEHVKRVCEVADGAVVGSALVDLLHTKWRDGAGREEVVAWVKALKAATLP